MSILVFISEQYKLIIKISSVIHRFKKWFEKVLKKGYILIDLKKIFSLKPLEFKIFILVESYDEKTAENYQNCYVTEKRIFSKLSTLLISNFDNAN